jgi:hypothetical protein
MKMRIQKKSSSRATVLVLVVVLVALLAIMGTTFVITSHINLQAVKNQVGGTASEGKVNGEEIDISVDSVISQIQTTLAEDLWGRPEDATATTDGTKMNGQHLLGLPTNKDAETANTVGTNTNINLSTVTSGTTTCYTLNEPWDAPVRFPANNVKFNYFTTTGAWSTTPLSLNVDGDPWLASSQYVNGTPDYWPQGTDLFLVKFTNSATQTDYWPGVFGNIPYVSLNTASANQKEEYADADGDGYLDSVWLYQKGFFTENPNTKTYTAPTYADVDVNGDYYGLVTDLPIKSSNPDMTYRMAVRIVDTSGMLNVNTAWQLPSDLPAAPTSADQLVQFSGDLLSGANLYGYTGSTSGTTFTYSDRFGYTEGQNLPGKAKDPTLENLLAFQNDYILRPENPDWNTLSGITGLKNFYPLDISDEMELRYKWISPGQGYKTGSVEPGNRTTLETLFSELDGATYTNSKTKKQEIPETKSDGIFDFNDTNYTTVTNNWKKREVLTAYSFSRNIRTETASTTGLDNVFPRVYNLQETLNDLVGIIHANGNTAQYPLTADKETRLQMFVQCIYDAFNSDKDETTMGQSHYADAEELGTNDLLNANYHTWQYIANLVDYLDDDDEPTSINTQDSKWSTVLGGKLSAIATSSSGSSGSTIASYAFNSNYVYGLECHAVISEISISLTKKDPQTAGDPPVVQRTVYTYKVEGAQVGNPWPTTVSRPDHVYLKIVEDSTTLKELTWKFTSGDMSKNFIYDSDDSKTTPYPATDSTEFSITVEGSSSSAPTVSLWAVSYDSNDVPEDIIYDESVSLPSTEGEVLSFIRNSNCPGSDDDGCWRSLVDQYKTTSVKTLGEKNTAYNASAFSLYTGYATSTTDDSLAPWVARDTTKKTDTSIWSTITVGSTTVYVANVKNMADLAAVPYVGFLKNPNKNDAPIGISDWLKKSDHKIRFKMASSKTLDDVGPTNTDEIKGAVFRDKIYENFRIVDRSNDGIDQLNKDGDNLATTHADDIDEMRLPGLVNVNTATSYYDSVGGAYVYALQALNPYITHDIAEMVQTRRPYVSGSRVLSSNTADLNQTGLFLTGVTSTTYDVVSPAVKWSRFANFITTRSDTFCAYIYVQALDKSGNVMAERREMAIFDRSLCNQPPLKWNPDPNNDGNTTDACWQTNPDYRPVKVVSRMRAE